MPRFECSECGEVCETETLEEVTVEFPSGERLICSDCFPEVALNSDSESDSDYKMDEGLVPDANSAGNGGYWTLPDVEEGNVLPSFPRP